jgi:HlyD family secretion protein
MSRAAAKRWILWAGIASLLALALLYAFRPQPLLVEVHVVQPAPFRVLLEAEGTTQIRDVFVVSAPVAGRVLRNPLEVGDLLRAGESVVATIQPSDPAFLDPRAQAESRHELEAAEAELQLAAAELVRAESEQTYAAAELTRMEALFSRGGVAQRVVDEARRAFRSADAAVAAARAAVEVRAHLVRRVRARLVTPAAVAGAQDDCACVHLRAPADGRVLRLFEKSEGVVAAGTPLLEIGDPAQIEIVADYLSADAVRIAPEQAAEIVGWGGEGVLEASVRRVEPFGFTRISALGIEEQRVNVVLDLLTPRAEWHSLGHGYRVMVRVVSHATDAALTVPVTALFRHQGQWHVFVVEAGVARQRRVEVGQRAGLAVQITTGLVAQERVIVNPPEALEDGMRVALRSAS